MKYLWWSIGALAILIGGYFIGVQAGWWKNILKKSPPVLPPVPKPSDCDPNNLGFQLNGIRNADCGSPAVLNCDPYKAGYNLLGFPDVNCGFGRQSQLRKDISSALAIAKNAEAQLVNQRMSTTSKINYINQQLKANGIYDMILIETGTNPPPEFKLCECKYGQHQVISFGQWAFGGGCGGISVGGSPCFPY